MFIYDVAPDNAFKREMMKFHYKVLYGLGMSKRYQLKDEKYTGLQKLQVAVLRFFRKIYINAESMPEMGKGIYEIHGTEDELEICL